jgi:transcription initiation factor TFIIIB Brf1 subunit/transcription initiation factor TFIIB
VYSKINELGEVLALPTRIRQTAKELLKQFEKKRDKNMKGVRKEAFLLAILLLAAKHEQGGRTLKGFSRATNIEEKDIKRFYKLLLRDPLLATPTGTMKPIEDEVKELVESFCNRLQQQYVYPHVLCLHSIGSIS